MKPTFAPWALVLVASSVASLGGPFSYLVTFGDSYTDEGRAAYFSSQGHAPPPGTTFSDTATPTFTGGYNWAEYAAVVNNATCFNYAVGGAMVNTSIIPRTFGSGPYPDVLGYQLSTYQTEIQNTTLYPNRTANNTVYALWIGQNDIGVAGFEGGYEVNNYSLTNYVDSCFALFDAVYNTGGRRFVIFNISPLDYAPTYTMPGQYGYLNNKYFSNTNCYNTTDYVDRIRQYGTSVARMFDYGVPFQLLVQKRWPGATFSVFNARQLMIDIYNNPTLYLSSPYVVKTPYRNCLTNPCQDQTQNPQSAYLWFDELHPSQQTSFLLAANFNVTAFAAPNKYGTTWVS